MDKLLHSGNADRSSTVNVEGPVINLLQKRLILDTYRQASIILSLPIVRSVGNPRRLIGWLLLGARCSGFPKKTLMLAPTAEKT